MIRRRTYAPVDETALNDLWALCEGGGRVQLGDTDQQRVRCLIREVTLARIKLSRRVDMGMLSRLDKALRRVWKKPLVRQADWEAVAPAWAEAENNRNKGPTT